MDNVEKVHPDYLAKPFWQLVLIYGHEWIRQQQAIFEKVMSCE